MSEKTRTSWQEIGKAIIGQNDIIGQLLTAIISNGHVLMIGMPGLAKTMLIRTVSEVLDMEFRRVQFTPDLMPSDITGTDILESDETTGKKEYRFIRGPIFTNILLADEINRTPPKTQAALLEAMQEHRVTAAGQTMTLKPPFFVLATQNPLEQEGTYPLPEAQLDRFMFSIYVDYPPEEDEATHRQSDDAAGEDRSAQGPRRRGNPGVAARRCARCRSRTTLSCTPRGWSARRVPGDPQVAGFHQEMDSRRARACARRNIWSSRPRRAR